MAAALGTVAAALAGVVTNSVKSYADYEQLVGGVEKLFGDSADIIKGYAEDAWKTSGVSANKYMEQVTSFSAALISSLGGDTAAAAEYADMAMRDMQDNANVFGSDIESIQHAYQGFAKGTYNMLDNLKLGYGGTQEEMYRLMCDAQELDSTFDAVFTLDEKGHLEADFADIVKAIHIVQDNMNITGTTMQEAEKTISGSITMMKASWENLMTGLADSNADIPELVNNVVSSAATVLENIIPVVKEVLKNIPAAIGEVCPEAEAALNTIIEFCQEAFPVVKEVVEAALTAVKEAFTWIQENQALLATIATGIGLIVAAIELYNIVAAVKAAMDAAQVTTLGALIAAYAAQAAACIAAIAPYVLIVAAIAAVIAIIVVCVKHWDEIKEAIANAWDAICETTKNAVDAVVNWFKELGEKISSKIEEIKSKISEKWEQIKQTISDKVQAAKDKVVETFEAIKSGISEKITAAKESVVNLFTTMKDNIKNKITEAKETVLNIFDGIKSGITEKIEAAKEKVRSVIDAIKGFFNFKFTWPSIPMPHFSISPSGWKVGDLLKGSIPKLGISWYAEGGVFDNPTLFGYGNGMLGGLGEHGAEAVVPLENNTEWLDKIATMLNEKQGGNQPIYLTVDGKVFAQLACDSINSLTRQRGSLPLKMY